MLLVLLLCQGTVSPGLDVGRVIEDLIPSLGGSAYADLVFWDEQELYQFADEVAQRLARNTGLFVVRDASTTVEAGTAVYNLPARHLSTIHASLGGAALRESSVEELEALDSVWRATARAPERITRGELGLTQLRLYPKPVAGGTLALIFHRYPATITPENRWLSAPLVLADYFTFGILAEARRKESEAAMPEVAAHLDERLALMEEVIRSYWGSAQ
jgi:hypothetical protein